MELEFSLKATRRLWSIVYGYQEAPHYDFVDFVLLQRRRDAQLWRTLTRLVDDARIVAAVLEASAVPLRPNDEHHAVA